MLACRRIGKFKVANSFIESAMVIGDHIAESDFFKGMVIIDVKTDLEVDCKWYVAIHPDFEEVGYGLLIPEYEALIDSLTGKVTWIKKPFI